MTNYTKSCIYKIASKDANINDIYIGSTCNFVKRRNQHKSACNNPNDKGYNLYVYRFIRDHGGWQNFNLYVIEKFSCTSKMQKEQVERGYIEELKPSLNKSIPTIFRVDGDIYIKSNYDKGYNKEIIYCPYCNHAINLHHKARHNKTKKHISNSSTSSSEASSSEEPDTIMFQMNKLHDDNVLKLQEIQNTFDKIDKIIR